MPPDARSDEELAADCLRQTGAERDRTVEELFARHYDRVARWCFRFTNDRDAAADLAQEVFLKAHRHLATFRGQARFSTWLYTIARNESLNRVTRAGPVEADEELLADVAAAEESPEARAERGERADWLRRFLAATLDATERAVFTMHYGDDMPLDAITRLLRLTNASGAKAYIVSARRKLARAARRTRARGEDV